MAALISWQTCYYTLSNYHFSAVSEEVWIVLTAFCCLFAYYVFQVLYDKYPAIREKVGEQLAEKICRLLIQACALLLAGFLIYHFLVFKPDSVQMQVDNMTTMMSQGRLPIFEMMV